MRGRVACRGALALGEVWRVGAWHVVACWRVACHGTLARKKIWHVGTLARLARLARNLADSVSFKYRSASSVTYNFLVI